MYLYGMRLRPFGMGCQPKGVEEVREDPSGKYWNILVYKRELSADEIYNYELDYLREEKNHVN